MRSGEDLVFALCHEVGNLVGAVRLHADGIDSRASARELANASVEIDDSSARIRSWLALVRPLLDREYGDESGVSPEVLLAGLHEELKAYGGRGVRLEVDAPAGLGAVRGRPQTLHHLLLTLAYHAVEEARPRGRVRLEAAPIASSAIALRVEDDGPEDPSLVGETEGATLTGRALACACASSLLSRLGGRAAAVREGGATRVELQLPLFE